jgi:putative zinc finger protein
MCPIRREGGRTVESHLTMEQVVAAIDGRVNPAERSVIDAHLAGCARCRAEYVQVSLLAKSAPPIVGPRRRWLPTAGLTTAAAIILAVALPLGRHQRSALQPASQRAAANESVVEIVEPAPTAAVSRDSLRFTWHAASGPTYRLIVTDSTGAELYSRPTPDTTLVLPSTVALHPGAPYFWFVDELRADGSAISSPASSFSIRP